MWATRNLSSTKESFNPYVRAGLGSLYIEGEGVPQDDGEAARWLVEAQKLARKWWAKHERNK